MKIRRILLATNNDNKIREFNKHFSNYGIDVVQVPKIDLNNSKERNDLINKYRTDKFIIVSIITESSNLYKDFKEVTDLKDGDQLMNISKLFVFDTKTCEIKKYESSVVGIIDYSKRNIKNSFAWDDIYVNLDTGRSYFEMRELDLKVSARDVTISKYIKDRFHYKDRIDLNFNKNFEGDDVMIFDSKEIFDNCLFKDLQYLDNKILKVIENGVFFRSAKNRIQKNYWLPGLNAGIPFTPKKDKIHEATFMFHDFMHFLVPDLIVGNSNNKDLYIIHRMMSEAFSLVYADMLYVHQLKLKGIDYDFSKRKIYPLYVDAIENKVSLKDLLFANARYVIFNDDSYLRKFVTKENLENYKKKYFPFFFEDYKWTNKNWENIKSQDLKVWNDVVDKVELENTYTIEKFEKCINYTGSDKEIIFEKVFDYYLSIFLNNTLSNENQYKNMLRRYCLGQICLFTKYLFNDNVKYFFNKCLQILSIEDVTLEDVYRYKELISSFILKMEEIGLISPEESFTYSEVYPIFKPFYVFYDEDLNYYQ